MRWNQNDYDTLRKTVKNFNKKIERILKKNPEYKDYLPSKINYMDIKHSIYSRKDFNRNINSYNRFLKSGSEKPILSKSGIKTTEWEKKELAIKVRTINTQRALKRKAANVSTEKGTMGTIKSNNLQPKKFDIDKISIKSWGAFTESVEKQIQSDYYQKQAEQYKKNYLNAIYKYLGKTPQTIQLYNIIKSLDPETIYHAYYEDPFLQISYTSDPIPADEIASTALEKWQSYIDELRM